MNLHELPNDIGIVEGVHMAMTGPVYDRISHDTKQSDVVELMKRYGPVEETEEDKQ